MIRSERVPLQYEPFRRLIGTINTSITDILSGVDIGLVFETRSSVQRVLKVLDGNKAPPQSRKKRSLTDITSDVVFDLISYRDIEVTQDQVYGVFSTLTSLQACYIPLQQYRAHALRTYDDLTDYGELESNAASLVEGVIWRGFLPTQTANSMQLAEEMSIAVTSALKHLKTVTWRNVYKDRRLVLWYQTHKHAVVADTRTLELPDYQNSSSDYERESWLQDWYDAVSSMTLQEVFSHIASLGDVRLQTALLVYFGYLSQAELSDHSSQKRSLTRDVKRACRLIVINQDSMPRSGFTDIRVLADTCMRHQNYYVANHIMKPDTTRLRLLHPDVYDSPYAQDDERKRVLELAAKRRGNVFLYTDRDIAEQTGLSTSQVEHILHRSIEHGSNGHIYNQNGHVISPGSNHWWLIHHIANMTESRLSCLTDLQRQILAYVTTPNDKGMYPNEHDAKQILGFARSGFLKHIRRQLE